MAAFLDMVLAVLVRRENILSKSVRGHRESAAAVSRSGLQSFLALTRF